MKKVLLRLGLVIALLFFVLYLIGLNSLRNNEPTNLNSTAHKESQEFPNNSLKDTIQDKPIDYSSFKYLLTGSDYAYNVKITSVETKVAKAAFTTKKDEYSVPQDVDGYYLKIKFTLTNPYEQEMMVPIPSYFFLSSTNKEFFAGSTIYNKSCSCKINNSTNVFNDKGKELWQFSEGQCGGTRNCVKFKPKETKSYTVKFNEPIFGEVKKLWLGGFNRYWKRPEDYSNRDWVLLLDLDKKEIVGEEKL